MKIEAAKWHVDISLKVSIMQVGNVISRLFNPIHGKWEREPAGPNIISRWAGSGRRSPSPSSVPLASIPYTHFRASFRGGLAVRGKADGPGRLTRVMASLPTGCHDNQNCRRGP